MVSEAGFRYYQNLTYHRPLSKYAEWEEAPQEGERFDYDAKPDRFYFEVESSGNLEPDAIIQQGIKVLQQKLALVIQDMSDGDTNTNGVNGGGYVAPRSPDVNMNGQWQEAGYTTPYGNGQASTWNPAGAATPYGATPYGQNGANGW